MARIRTIKPEFWEDEKLSQLSLPCRLFYIGCWNFADDFGVIKSNAALLKSWIFPYDENLRVSEIKKWIDALVDAQMLVPIIYNRESYCIIRTFRNHQTIDKRYEKSYFPKEQVIKIIEDALQGHNDNTMGTHSEHIVNTPQERKGEERKGEDNISCVRPPVKKFIPPTIEEVKVYCSERGNNVNPEQFVSYYTANGWKVGKNPMKDWKAAVRTWENNGYSNNSKNNGGNQNNPLSNQQWRDPNRTEDWNFTDSSDFG